MEASKRKLVAAAVFLTIAVLAFNLPYSMGNLGPSDTVEIIGSELASDRPDYREVYDLISDEADKRSFEVWREQRKQKYSTYRSLGFGYEFEGVVNESVNGDRAVVWWKVRNLQSEDRSFLKRTTLVKEGSTWKAVEDIKISESYNR